MSAKYSKNFILLFITAVIWGAAFVAQSVAMDYIGPYTFNTVRTLLGGIALIPCISLLSCINKKEKPPAAETERAPRDLPRDLLVGGVLCGFLLFVSTSLQQVGIQYTTVAKAGFITCLYIIIVPILGILLNKKAEKKLWVCVVIALAGLYLLCMKGSFSLSKGDFLILICSLCFSVHILVIDYFTVRVSGTKLACIQFFVAGVFSAIPMFLLEAPRLREICAAWLPIAYAGIFSCGVAYTFQIIGQRGTPPTAASLILSLESVISVLAGWLLLGQSLTPREIAGCVLMFCAIVLAQIKLPGKSGRQT